MPLDENSLFYSEHVSWYKAPKVDKRQSIYLHLLENIFMVENAEKEWVPYNLTPHQIDFHIGDATCIGYNSKTDIVIKSRGTSFTVSSLIRILISLPTFKNRLIPLYRLNILRAKDLILQLKSLIEHMKPMEMNGKLFPFDPKQCDFKSSFCIRFKDLGVEIRAFPVTNASADAIRGERIIGVAGLQDEVNFMPDFTKLYRSHRDTTSGADEYGKSIFQITIGTTREGALTPFNIWYEDILEKQSKNIINNFRILQWPVFNPEIFNMYYKKNPVTEIPFTENNELVSIVPWHTKSKLWSKYCENQQSFMEEFMCILSDSSEAFYTSDLTLKVLHNDMPENWNDFITHYYNPNKIYIGGTDPASINDYYVNTVFEVSIPDSVDIDLSNNPIQKILSHPERVCKQVYLEYTNKTDLDDMGDNTSKIISAIKPYKWRIDAQGVGLQISQRLIKNFGTEIIEPINAGSSIKGVTNHSGNVKLKEFIHTNQKKMMIFNKVSLIKDEMQIRHYSGWNYKFECPSSKEYGHGDITIANGIALLPEGFRQGLQNVDFHISSKYTKPLFNNEDAINNSNNSNTTNEEPWWMKAYMKNRRKLRTK